MSKLLTNALPDFYSPLEHWTSERRKYAGVEPIDQADIDFCSSSFTIPDLHGAFTKFLSSSGLDECQLWMDTPPTYHIEVVGTEKGLYASFPMRSEWWQMVRRASKFRSQCLVSNSLA